MKKITNVVTIRIITILMLISLPFLGSDCEEILNPVNPTGQIQGSWTYVYNAGTIRDICPGETVSFPSNSGGTATLKCPEQNPIDRNYSVSGSTLTYTASNMQYAISFTQSNELVLSGTNNSRILYYARTITDNTISNLQQGDNNSINNSSEIK